MPSAHSTLAALLAFIILLHLLYFPNGWVEGIMIPESANI